MKDIAKWFLKCSQWFIIISFQSDVKTQWKLWAGIGFNHFKVIFSRASTVTVLNTPRTPRIKENYLTGNIKTSQLGFQSRVHKDLRDLKFLFFSFQCWIIGFSQKGIKKKKLFLQRQTWNYIYKVRGLTAGGCLEENKLVFTWIHEQANHSCDSISDE